MFSAEPDLSEFVVEDYDPRPRPAPVRAAARAPAPPPVSHAASQGDARSVGDGGGADSGLTAAQQARKERIAAARAAAFGTDEGHLDRQPEERQWHASDNGRGHNRQSSAADSVRSGGSQWGGAGPLNDDGSGRGGRYAVDSPASRGSGGVFGAALDDSLVRVQCYGMTLKCLSLAPVRM